MAAYLLAGTKGLPNPQRAGSAQDPIPLRPLAHGPKKLVTLTVEGLGTILSQRCRAADGPRGYCNGFKK